MQLLTQKDLAERWQVSLKTIERYRLDGIIKSIDGIPSVRFHPTYIEDIEGFLPEPKTWIELKLEKKVEALEKENQYLKQILAEINFKCLSIYNYDYIK